MEKEIKVMNIRHQYSGVGFIKTRKNASCVMHLAETMIANADKRNLKLLDVIVDDSSGMDVDRDKIDKLMAWMEKDYVDAIVVKSIWDITRNPEDLMQFMVKAESLDVSIYDMERGMNLACIPWNGDCGC